MIREINYIRIGIFSLLLVLLLCGWAVHFGGYFVLFAAPAISLAAAAALRLAFVFIWCAYRMVYTVCILYTQMDSVMRSRTRTRTRHRVTQRTIAHKNDLHKSNKTRMRLIQRSFAHLWTARKEYNDRTHEKRINRKRIALLTLSFPVCQIVCNCAYLHSFRLACLCNDIHGVAVVAVAVVFFLIHFGSLVSF